VRLEILTVAGPSSVVQWVLSGRPYTVRDVCWCSNACRTKPYWAHGRLPLNRAKAKTASANSPEPSMH
jgi:hypothetical protein